MDILSVFYILKAFALSKGVKMKSGAFSRYFKNLIHLQILEASVKMQLGQLIVLMHLFIHSTNKLSHY